MAYSLQYLASLVGGEVVGDSSVVIDKVSAIENADGESIAFLADRRYFSYLSKTKAAAIIVHRSFSLSTSKILLKTDNPGLAFATIAQHFVRDTEKFTFPYLAKNAVISKEAIIDREVHIGNF